MTGSGILLRIVLPPSLHTCCLPILLALLRNFPALTRLKEYSRGLVSYSRLNETRSACQSPRRSTL